MTETISPIEFDDLLELASAYASGSDPNFWRDEVKLKELLDLRQKMRELGGDITHPWAYLLDLTEPRAVDMNRLRAKLLREIVMRVQLRCPKKLTPKHVYAVFDEAEVSRPDRDAIRYAIKTVSGY